MFYSHTILARKSPLGTVWIAAHLERKIKKPQIDGIDIPSYAECIMSPEVPIALRLSGHLLLGLVRIYSWKVNYLFQDCNRMLTTIRTAFASVQVNLPIDADHAPFEAITLPDTFNLDDLNLDDAIHQIDSPDKHRKTLDQITLDEGDYVMVDIDEDARSASGRSSYVGPEPEDDGTLPLSDTGFEERNNRTGQIPVDPSRGDMPEQPKHTDHPNELEDTPEVWRKAPVEDPEWNLSENRMDAPKDNSPFVPKSSDSPPMDEILSPDLGSLPGTSRPNLPGTTTPGPNEDDVLPHMDNPLPDIMLEPSPSQVQENEPSPRQVEENKGKRRPKLQGNKRTKKPKFDEEIVFSNAYMKRQTEGDEDELSEIVSKRRKLPQSSADLWKFNRIRQKDVFFHGPLVDGICTKLHETYERQFPRVSNSDADDGVHQASPERQLTPKSPDAPPGPKSPGNEGAQPECPPTPDSIGNPDPPELPRHFPPDILSPISHDDTPFKPPGGTPESDGTYATTIQMTHDTNPMASPFPFDHELDADLPEIPWLMSTPGVKSSAGTGTTGLGSMSTRTRAVAKYFKDHLSSSTSEGQPGKFTLDRLLVGRTRKQAARMLFETLVLKSYDYIDVQQEEAYGDITVSVKPSLSSANL